MAKSKLLEQRKVIMISCYREEKFAITPDVPPEMHEVFRQKQICRFGFTEMQPVCQECKWFKISKVSDGSKVPMMTDREITADEVENLRVEYAVLNRAFVGITAMKED